MTTKNKEYVFDLLLRELQSEVEFKSKSEEVRTTLEATKDFNASYFKGIDRLTNYMMIEDIIKEEL